MCTGIVRIPEEAGYENTFQHHNSCPGGFTMQIVLKSIRYQAVHTQHKEVTGVGIENERMPMPPP